MNTPTLGDKLGLPPRASPLLRKAAGLGLPDAAKLEALAVARGCWHYRHPQLATVPTVSESHLSNEELAIALLSSSQPYSPHTIRVGAAMLGAQGNDPATLAGLARTEGCEAAVCYIAQSALKFEPDNPFWHDLLERVPCGQEPADGIFPHPTRFVSMTGITRAGVGRVVVWIRPRTDLATAHG
jgi:hypothetical protein